MAITHAKMALADSFRFREVLYNLLSQDLKSVQAYLSRLFLVGAQPDIAARGPERGVFQIMRTGLPHYALFLFSGNLAWTFLSGALITGSGALLENESFIKKNLSA